MKLIRYSLFFVTLCTIAVFSCSGDAGSGSTDSTKYKYSFNDNIHISSDGATEPATIAANILIPIAKSDGEKFPAIIFGNSWALEEHEYLAQAIHFARKGYIVLSFSSRGWGLSTGKVALGSPDDWADFSAVVDWLINNSPVDGANIGVCGVSLGGGTALNGIAHDSRIKTAAAISTWTDLERHMWSDVTPRMVWGSILVITGAILAHMNDDIYNIFNCTLTNTNISWLKEWCTLRSPITYIDEINKKNIPVYIANNMEDYMFVPDTVLDFFNALTVDHKRIDLSLGTHITSEATGLLGLENHVFKQVDRWFDYWLKGIGSDIIPDPNRSAVITMQLKNSLERVEYNTANLYKANGVYAWPANQISSETFYCAPRSLLANGSLSSSANTENSVDEIYSGLSLVSGVTSGVIVFPILEQLGVRIVADMSELNRFSSIAWESSAFTAGKKIRGVSQVTLRISLTQSAGQVVAYLYDVDSSGSATYITHGFHSFWDAVPGEVVDITFPIIATAYNIPAGNHLAMVVNTADALYASPTSDPFFVHFSYGSTPDTQMTLKVPVEN